jgi:hypothetical protein
MSLTFSASRTQPSGDDRLLRSADRRGARIYYRIRPQALSALPAAVMSIRSYPIRPVT